MDWQPVARPGLEPKREAALAGLLVLAGAVYFFIVNAVLSAAGVDSPESLYFAHHAALAYSGQGFNIRDVIDPRSPLTHSLYLALRNPLVAASLLGGGFLACAIMLGVAGMRARYFGRLEQGVWVAALVLSPSLVALCALEPSDCLRLSLGLCAYALLHVYNDRGYSLHMFSFSILCAVMLYAGGQAVVFCLALVPVVVATARRKNMPAGTLLVVYATPLAFIFASLVFLRWTFNDADSGLGSLYAPFAGALPADAMRGNLWASLSATLRLAREHAPAFLPLLASLAVSLPRWKRMPDLCLFLVAWPLVELYGELVFGLYRDPSLFSLTAATSSLLVLRLPPGAPWRPAARLAYAAALGAWLFVDWSLALQGPPVGANLVARVALGEKPRSESAVFRGLAARLSGGSGRILMDNGQLYPLAVFLDKPERLVLPHHALFEAAMSSPASFARFVVVRKDDPHDQILRKHPQAAQGRLEGYVPVFREGEVLAFERL